MTVESHDTSALPQFAPGLLAVSFPHGTSYDNAKQLLEDLGLIVHEKRLMWEYSWTTLITIPDEELNQWITRLQVNSRITDIQKIPLRYALAT